MIYGSFDEINKMQIINRIQQCYIKNNETRRPLKILSDVDDTLFSSGGSLAGYDTSYPKACIYPGVTTFYKELDIGPEESDGEWESHKMGNLVFLTARPHVKYALGASEKISHKTFKEFNQKGILHTRSTLLAGDLEGFKGAAMKDFSPMAEKKYSNFTQYAVIQPEYDFIFFGDNGQGDTKAGLNMLDNYPERMKGVFMHQVIPKEKTFGYNSSPKWKEIIFFDTYIGAAEIAYNMNLISLSGLKRVLEAAQKEFELIKWDSSQQKKNAKEQLERDITLLKLHKLF
uniref:Phosphatidate phosphatase APP1 catalytic domain-containing protein n=1 Tax=Arcella intermedia TaxID=1963864 RepID=A0A6B2LCF3_9EUKA